MTINNILMILKEIKKQHGGTIEVLARDEEGSLRNIEKFEVFQGTTKFVKIITTEDKPDKSYLSRFVFNDEKYL